MNTRVIGCTRNDLSYLSGSSRVNSPTANVNRRRAVRSEEPNVLLESTLPGKCGHLQCEGEMVIFPLQSSGTGRPVRRFRFRHYHGALDEKANVRSTGHYDCLFPGCRSPTPPQAYGGSNDGASRPLLDFGKIGSMGSVCHSGYLWSSRDALHQPAHSIAEWVVDPAQTV